MITMISKDEMCGIIETLGALNKKEIEKIVIEIQCIRNENYDNTLFEDLLNEIESEKLVDKISEEYICQIHKTSLGNSKYYYIISPKAFPQIPPELSEVIDVLELNERKVNKDKIFSIYATTTLNELNTFNQELLNISKNSSYDYSIPKLEGKYSELFNNYHDLDFWSDNNRISLLKDIEEKLNITSKLLESIRTK